MERDGGLAFVYDQNPVLAQQSSCYSTTYTHMYPQQPRLHLNIVHMPITIRSHGACQSRGQCTCQSAFTAPEAALRRPAPLGPPAAPCRPPSTAAPASLGPLLQRSLLPPTAWCGVRCGTRQVESSPPTNDLGAEWVAECSSLNRPRRLAARRGRCSSSNQPHQLAIWIAGCSSLNHPHQPTIRVA